MFKAGTAGTQVDDVHQFNDSIFPNLTMSWRPAADSAWNYFETHLNCLAHARARSILPFTRNIHAG
jgi:hypothetical protein